jgi:hypothetical protein
MSNSKEIQARAEAIFKRKEEQARQGAKAWEEYQAQRRDGRKDGTVESTPVGERGSIEMMVVLCQRRSVGGNPRQLNHGPKIDFGEGRQAGSSGGPGAFSSQISRCATPSATT